MAGRGFSMGGTTYAIGYSHDAMGHISTVNYPDGNQANYTLTDGVVSGVSLTVGGTVLNGATAITYRPPTCQRATQQLPSVFIHIKWAAPIQPVGHALIEGECAHGN